MVSVARSSRIQSATLGMLVRYAHAVGLLISRAAEEKRPAMACRARLNADLSLDSLKA
jgi:hypothetical protein